jgi:hypothetical protein
VLVYTSSRRCKKDFSSHILNVSFTSDSDLVSPLLTPKCRRNNKAEGRHCGCRRNGNKDISQNPASNQRDFWAPSTSNQQREQEPEQEKLPQKPYWDQSLGANEKEKDAGFKVEPEYITQ